MLLLVQDQTCLAAAASEGLRECAEFLLASSSEVKMTFDRPQGTEMRPGVTSGPLWRKHPRKPCAVGSRKRFTNLCSVSPYGSRRGTIPSRRSFWLPEE